MISHLAGVLTKKHESRQAIEITINGSGYEVLLPTFVWRALEETPLGEEVEFDIYYHVNERSPTPMLVGFTREVEREFFKKMVDVPDLGPIKSMRALSFSISTIATWIEQSDETALRTLPGVGQRLQQPKFAGAGGPQSQLQTAQDLPLQPGQRENNYR